MQGQEQGQGQRQGEGQVSGSPLDGAPLWARVLLRATFATKTVKDRIKWAWRVLTRRG